MFGADCNEKLSIVPVRMELVGVVATGGMGVLLLLLLLLLLWLLV